MEWNRLQIQFLLDNKDLVEKEDWDEFYTRAIGSSLSPFERRHLMAGIAIVAGLDLELDIHSSGYGLFVITKTGNDIAIFRRSSVTYLSDVTIMRSLSEDLKTMRFSSDLITSVIGKMKVKRS